MPVRKCCHFRSYRFVPAPMFPVSRLFLEITCPDYTTCSLNPCLFSHQPPARAMGVRTSAVLQVQAQATGSVPQKRAAELAEDSASNKTARIEVAPRGAGGTPSNRSASSVVASTSASSALSRSQPQASTSKLVDVSISHWSFCRLLTRAPKIRSDLLEFR